MTAQRIAAIGISNTLGSDKNALSGWVAFVSLTIVSFWVQRSVRPYPDFALPDALVNRLLRSCACKAPLRRFLHALSWNSLEELGLASQFASLLIGLFYLQTKGQDGVNVLGSILGVLSMFIYGCYITSTFLAITLRVWTLTLERKRKRYAPPPQSKKKREEADPMAGAPSGLHTAAAIGDREALLTEMAHGEFVNSKRSAEGDRDVSAMFLAAKFGHDELVRLLLAAGGDPNIGSGYGRWTPLHVAATQGVALSLLEQGADPSLRDTFGNSAAEQQRKDALQGIQLEPGQFVVRTPSKHPQWNTTLA